MQFLNILRWCPGVLRPSDPVILEFLESMSAKESRFVNNCSWEAVNCLSEVDCPSITMLFVVRIIALYFIITPSLSQPIVRLLDRLSLQPTLNKIKGLRGWNWWGISEWGIGRNRKWKADFVPVRRGQSLKGQNLRIYQAQRCEHCRDLWWRSVEILRCFNFPFMFIK